MIRPRFYHLLLSFISLIFINLAKAQYISVDTSLSDQDLVNKFIGTQNCVTVSNVFISGSNVGTDPSYGYFTKNGSNFDIDEGIILSTGSARAAEGPNTYRQDNGVSGWGGDLDLADVFGTSVNNYKNATYLEFDFVSNESSTVSFQYMFLSEEYDKLKSPNGCSYSDAFAFLIKPAGNLDPYTNIALVPNTNDPVSVVNVRGSGGTCPSKNEDYFGTFNLQSSTSTSPTNFNGQTKVLNATATVQVGVMYHIKLVIADEGTTGHDSAVFLKTGSFTGNIDIGKDLTVANADPLCKNVKYPITPNPPINDPAARYFWFKDGLPIAGIPTNQNSYDVEDEGNFSLRVVLGSGCTLEGAVKIEKAPVAKVDTSPKSVCDGDFSGSYTAKLSDFNNQIVTNYSSDFKISYSLTSGGTPIDPDSDFEFTQNPQKLYVSVGAYSCTPDIYPIDFIFGTKLSFNTVETVDICDNDISGNQTFNLADYIPIITAETGVTPSFFGKEQEAMAGGNSTVSNSQTIDADQSIFIRIEKDLFCPNYKKINFKFKQPKESELLKNMKTVICKGVKIDLIAETNFDYYKWSNGVEGQFANKIEDVGADEYFVELTSNGCVYKQFIKITEAEDPVIDNVLIEGTTVTVLVSGGTLPYQYALDGGNYQSSNIFNNVELGAHKVYVKGADGCSVIAKDFTLINSQNYITPNNDGVNDVINYSSLLQKLEPKFEIYDRFGVQVFKGDTNNQYIWNGTASGRVLPTSSYWYILEWNEAGNPERTKLSGWILLKNRN